MNGSGRGFGVCKWAGTLQPTGFLWLSQNGTFVSGSKSGVIERCDWTSLFLFLNVLS